MTSTLLTLTLAVFAADPPPAAKEKPKHSAIAPSLPFLTPEEEDKLDKLIDQFILFDTGRLAGAEGEKAKKEFDKLGREAIPALIRGLNKAAVLEHSCPTLVIGRKLSRMLLASNDQQLLDFAHDEIGAGVGRSQHASALQDLRFQCQMRKNLLARAAPTGRQPAEPKPVKQMTLAELADASLKDTGVRQKTVITEMSLRRGSDAVTALGFVVVNADSDLKPFAGKLLDLSLSQQTAAIVKEKLKDTNPEVRQAAAKAVGSPHTTLTGELIDLLADDYPEVRTAAHSVLRKRNKADDFGPSENAEPAEIEAAQKKWRKWWAKQAR